MSSIANLLGIARSALGTHQRAIDVTGHNIANAQTPGYSRQRLDMQAAVPLRTPDGLVGRGVTDSGVERLRDRFADDSFRRESALQRRSRTLADMLGQLEAAFGEPSDSGLAASLDGLFSAFGDLANDPANPVTRSLAQQAARQVTQQLRRLDGQVTQTAAEAADRLRAGAADANLLLDQVASLNRAIVEAGGPLRRAADLEDQRDQLLDRLADLTGARALRRDDGSVAVIIGDALMVDGGANRRLAVQGAPGGGLQLGIAGAGTPVRLPGGSLQGYAEITTTFAPQVRAGLDTLAAGLVAEVNAIHRTGVTPAGATGTDFFDPAGTTAQTIALAPAIAASPAAIAAGATSAAGDGAVALQLAGLRTTGVAAFGGRTIAEAYSDVVSGLGVAVKDAEASDAAQDVLVTQADVRRQQVAGVSIDEEMVRLIAQQQAFAAAARLVTVADEMMQSVLQMV